MVEYGSAYGAYKAAHGTLSKTRQVVMLYEGAIKFISQGKQAIQEKRIEDRYNLIQRAADIISGLQDSLDFENGGDIAPMLHGFYSDVYLSLMDIHRNNDAAECDEVTAQLKEMLDIWRKIDKGEFPGAESAPASSPTAGGSGDTANLPPISVKISV